MEEGDAAAAPVGSSSAGHRTMAGTQEQPRCQMRNQSGSAEHVRCEERLRPPRFSAKQKAGNAEHKVCRKEKLRQRGFQASRGLPKEQRKERVLRSQGEIPQALCQQTPRLATNTLPAQQGPSGERFTLGAEAVGTLPDTAALGRCF